MTLSNARVSVVMPVYNCAGYIQDAIRSVCSQTEPDLELIVVDDGSSDDTPHILRSLAARDRRIRLHHQAASRKPAIARNVGLKQARGEFVAFLDGDDLWHPDRLQRELTVFERHRDIDIVFADLQKFSVRPGDLSPCGWLASDRFVSRAQRFLRPVGAAVYLCAPDFYRFMSSEVTGVNMQTVMVRRTVLKAEPYCFNEDILVGEDADLFFRLATRCRLAFIDDVLAYYRQRSDSVTSDWGRRLESEIRVYRDNLVRARAVLTRPELTKCRRQVAWRYHALGQCFYGRGDMLSARKAYAQAFIFQPRAATIMGWLKTGAPMSVIAWVRRLKQAQADRTARGTSRA